MTNLAIFASGKGSNARKITEFFQDDPAVQVRCIISNKKEAPVLEMAREKGIETRVLTRPDFYDSDATLKYLHQRKINWIILAGFLWLVPPNLIKAYPKKILNIHPALLPKFGGKGMYGMRVHEAVKAAGEEKTGITIHYVNEVYDAGEIIFQATTPVAPGDSPEDIAGKVHALEHRHYPALIGRLIQMRETSRR